MRGLFVVVVVALALAVSTNVGLVVGDSCIGKIGQYTYNISKLQGTEVSVQGQHGLYYYMPCGIVEQKKCTEKGEYPSPAVCQKDKNNNYWPVGENDQVTWKPRDSNPAGDKGFKLYFANGDNRETIIEFICDEAVDPGTLAVGNPEQTNNGQITTYYLQWTTKYACPDRNPPKRDLLDRKCMDQCFQKCTYACAVNWQ